VHAGDEGVLLQVGGQDRFVVEPGIIAAYYEGPVNLAADGVFSITEPYVETEKKRKEKSDGKKEIRNKKKNKKEKKKTEESICKTKRQSRRSNSHL